MSTPQLSESLFFIERGSSRSLQAQLREAVVSAVLGGHAPKGARMPSTRRLAQHLNVARITVTQAYQELVAQGYLEVQARKCYVVSGSAPLPAVQTSGRAARRSEVDWQARIGGGLQERPRLHKPVDWQRYPFPFIYGQADMSLFHHRAWRECAVRAMGRRDFESMAGDLAEGDDPMLVDYIWSRALPRRGISCARTEILVTVGAQNALWLAITLLSRHRLRVVCENPCYPDTAAGLGWAGASVTRVDVDEHGLAVEQIPPDTDVVFVTPSHQSPTAVTMPAARRRRLLALAHQHDFVVVEDDYEFEMSFLAPPSPALKSMDSDGRVIHVGSFSKALFPGLRLGYLVGPEPFLAEARQLRALMLRHPPGVEQRTVAYFLASGHYDSLIADTRTTLARRHAVMLGALGQNGLEIANAGSFGGSNVWVRGPDGLDSTRLAAQLRDEGVLIEPGAPFFADGSAPSACFRMAYSSIPRDRIEEGVGKVARRLRRRT